MRAPLVLGSVKIPNRKLFNLELELEGLALRGAQSDPRAPLSGLVGGSFHLVMRPLAMGLRLSCYLLVHHRNTNR